MSHITTPPLGLTSDVSTEDDIFRKITLRLVPFLFLCYLAAYLDRVNVGFANSRRRKSLRLARPFTALAPAYFFLATYCSKCQAMSSCTRWERDCG
jgi:hypothetical protein